MYDKYGIVERPLMAYLPSLIQDIQAAAPAGAWQAAVANSLVGTNGNIAPNRFVDEVHPQEIFAAIGSASGITAASPAFPKLLHFVMLNLHSAGFIKKKIVTLEYRRVPELTADEMVDRLLSLKVPLAKAEDFTGGRVRWVTFCHLLPIIMQKVLYLADQRQDYIARIRRKTQQIGYAISVGRSITQSEKSLFLMMAPGGSRSMLASELAAGAVPTPLPVADSNDNMVNDLWRELEGVVMAGPASRFREFTSVLNGRQLSFYYGPPPRELKFYTGYAEWKGPFVTFETEPVLSFPWTAASQLSAVTERAAAIVSAGANPFVIPPPVQIAVPGSLAGFLSLDEPEFRLSFAVSGSVPYCHEFEVDYSFEMTGRPTSTTAITAEGAFPGPQALWYDLGYKQTNRGAGDGLVVDWSEHLVIDLAYSSLSTQPPNTTGAAGFTRPTTWRETLVYPDTNTRSVVIVPSLDVAQLYYRGGGTLMSPCFRDQVLIPRSWLFESRDTDLEFILGRIALTRAEATAAKPALTASHNMALLARCFPPSSLPTLNPVMIAASVL